MANKISVILEASVDKAVSGLKGFKQSIQDADGATNKFKAGAASAFDSVKANAGNLAMVAGAAVAAFGAKAVTAFQDAALAAGHLADASGLTVDAASRWIAVGDDIGVSSETIQKSFGKMAKEIGTGGPLLDQYGIAVRKGADGQADMNATMLHAIDVLRGIQDPTKKAELAQQLLGRGWQDMAELIEQGSGSLTKSMAEVSEAQVIDKEEVEKARKMRESMDNLQDSVHDLSLALGEELVPTVALLADGLTELIKPLMAVNEWSKDVALSWMDMLGIIENKKPIDDAATSFGYMVTAQDMARVAAADYTEFQQGMKDAIEESTEATGDAVDAADKLTEAERRLIQTTETLTNRYRDLKGELSEEEDFHNAEKMWDDLKQSAVDSYNAASEGAEDAKQKAFDHESAVIDAKQAVVDMGEKYKDIPKETVTRIVALIDQGQLEEAERQFAILTRNRDMNINIVARGGAGYGVGTFAEGGTVPGPIGQPQLAVVHGGEEVIPVGGNTNGNGHGTAPVFNLTVNAGPLANGKEIGDIIVSELKRYTRRNGPGWMG